MEELINKYLEYIRKKNLSINTIDAYGRDICKFKKYLEDNKVTFDNIDSLIVTGYVEDLIQKGKKKSSIARNVICIRNFYKYLAKNEYVQNIPIIKYNIPKYERNIPEILSIYEVNNLLSIPNISTEKGIRDKTMMVIMYETGIKITELLDLSFDQVAENYEYLTCKGTKNEERIITLGQSSSKWLKKYITIRKSRSSHNLQNVFLNSKGEKMTRQGFWKIIKHYSQKAGINKIINLYTLRHSAAVHLIENGTNFAVLKEMLGYKDISAIQVYLDIVQKNKLMKI